LERQNDLAAQHDRVLATVRTCAVRADASNDDVDRIGAGVGAAFGDVDNACHVAGRHVECQRVIRLAETLPEIVVLHCSRAEYAFLGRLHNEHERAIPVILALGHAACRTDQAGDVHVVPTGMHREHLIAGDRVFLRRP